MPNVNDWSECWRRLHWPETPNRSAKRSPKSWNLPEEANAVEGSGSEAKLGRLRRIMQDEGFFDHADQRLLLFTEFKDTLDYLMEQLERRGASALAASTAV